MSSSPDGAPAPLSRRGLAAMAAAGIAASPAFAKATPMSDHLAKLHALIADWQRKDIDAVLARVTDDLEWHYLVGLPPLNGKPAARAFLEKFGAQISDIRWRIFDCIQKGDKLMVEGVDEYTTATGSRVVVPYMGILEFRGNLICRWRDYCDSALAGRLKAGEAVPAHVATLADRKPI